MTFSDAIKIIRKKRLLSQEAFASEIGVSFTTVNRWENGKSIPTFKMLKCIDDYCKTHKIDINISELLTEDDLQ